MFKKRLQIVLEDEFGDLDDQDTFGGNNYIEIYFFVPKKYIKTLMPAKLRNIEIAIRYDYFDLIDKFLDSSGFKQSIVELIVKELRKLDDLDDSRFGAYSHIIGRQLPLFPPNIDKSLPNIKSYIIGKMR
jgi:hypothetical protein